MVESFLYLHKVILFDNIHGVCYVEGVYWADDVMHYNDDIDFVKEKKYHMIFVNSSLVLAGIVAFFDSSLQKMASFGVININKMIPGTF